MTDTRHTVTVRITSDSLEAADHIRQIVADALADYVTSAGRTERSRRDKYRGGGIAYIRLTVPSDDKPDG